MRTRVISLLAAILLFAAAAAAAAAAKPDWSPCLDCHDDDALTLTTTAGETLPLAVTAAELSGSAHHGVQCQGCHPRINLDSHPEGNPVASIEQFRADTAKACFSCHPERKLRAKGQHAGVISANPKLSCAECHGSHRVQRVAAWRGASATNEFCLRCHSRSIMAARPGGATYSIRIDEAKLKASVHPDHSCVDCHADFSVTSHPSAAGERGTHAVVSTRACARCHAEKMRQAEGSIHFTLLRSGVAGAPGCTDCHSPHTVAPKERYATLTGMPCRGCHEEIFAAYAGSMHGTARATERHLDAPLCSDCHRAHDVRGSASPALVREACLGCHPQAGATHEAWLPNAALHLQAVSCAACHAPTAQRVVALRLTEKGTGRSLTEREVGELFGGDAAAALDPARDGIDGQELWNALRQLESRRLASAAKLEVVGRLEVARGAAAHRLANKAGAVRSCESCHEAGSKAFDRVALSLARDDGRPKDFNGRPGMLTDAASVLSVRGFYALGGTRSVVLDWLLVLAVAGGFAVIGAHLSARLWTARSRKEG
ncbi:MAG TPA: cytochrome c3 family protein [Candidatus Methanoperedens sp.]|nr:cytochrome c3 family protein [Candidatus Methanoperedens sp.]